MEIDHEKLAYWYFRLNGFLNIKNFIVHPNQGSDQKTEVDLLGVRFPHRRELHPDLMLDDPIFEKTNLPYLVIADVTNSRCGFNPSWKNPEKKCMQSILYAVGILPVNEVESAAASLYQHGVYENEQCCASWFSIGSEQSRGTATRKPKVPQLIWDDVLTFVYQRFRQYQPQKKAHVQWNDTDIEKLWEMATDANYDESRKFVAAVNVI